MSRGETDVSSGGSLRSRLTSRPVRLVLVIGTVLTLGLAVLEMSGSGQRISVTNAVPAAIFAADVHPGQRLCQPNVTIPADGAAVQMTIGSYDLPMPRLHVRLRNSAGRIVDSGTLPAGGPQGVISIPLRHPGPATGTLCLTVRRHKVAVGGLINQPLDSYSLRLDGKRQPARAQVTTLRAGSESWWSLLPTVFRRFGYGKWSVLGSWTLIAAAVALGLVWFIALRLMWKEAS